MINITQEEFIKKAQQDHFLILDVRRPDECASGIVANATTINFMDSEFFIEEIKKLDKTIPYLVYCRSGNRSGKACAMMDEMGFSATYNLIGGMLDWDGELSF